MAQESLIKRFWLYQKERFPFLTHGLLITCFSFSAVSYSRISRDAMGFIEWEKFAICIFNTITIFFLLRVFDEHKDAEDDAKYRSELPVPRGLISLKELRTIGLAVFFLQIIVNAITFPSMLWLYAGVMIYMSLMGKEFFVVEWLKKHQFWYVVSHMFIIPFVDVFASGFDWHLEGVSAPFGLLFFFAVSFMNGIVLEVGRKIRAPENEKEGVLTYSHLLGPQKSVWLWIAVLFATLGFAAAAAHYAHHGVVVYVVLIACFLLTLIPAISYLKSKSAKSAKAIEIASGLWTMAMYLTLGGIVKLIELI